MAKKKTTTKKGKIQYGEVEMPEGFHDPKNAKVLISIRVDGDVLEAFKKRAEREGKKYQALMHEVLRHASLNQEESSFGEMAKELAHLLTEQFEISQRKKDDDQDEDLAKQA
ncbi:MAG: BrnA antitoxin family protein [Bdellovibrionota bacterium]